MNADHAFRQAITADPEDDGLRLVYADWLEEHGDVRGEYLRLECALATMLGDGDQYAATEARLDILRESIDPSWLDEVGKLYDVMLTAVEKVHGVNVMRNVREVMGTGIPEAMALVQGLVDSSIPCVILRRVSWRDAQEARRMLLAHWTGRPSPVDMARVKLVISTSPGPRAYLRT
jgi:uncharacterized protein (TIGR02996 family)